MNNRIHAQAPYGDTPVTYESWDALIDDINIEIGEMGDGELIATVQQATEWMDENEWEWWGDVDDLNTPQ